MNLIAKISELLRRVTSKETRRAAVRLGQWPPVGQVRFGHLRRVSPINDNWGAERGGPIDRYYIEQFLERHRGDVRGDVLEIGTDAYTRRFGDDRVTNIEVLHVAERKASVTAIGDLTDPVLFGPDRFDCVILTQTLQVIYDVPAVVRTVYRILRPGGVVLVTASGISRISRYDMDRWGHFWGFTTKSLERLFRAEFPPDAVEVESHGNVLSATAFLYGLSPADLTPSELDHRDDDFQLVVCLKAKKSGENR